VLANLDGAILRGRARDPAPNQALGGCRNLLDDTVEERARVLAERLAEDDMTVQVPRLFLIEDEYQRAMLRAELEWVRGLIADLGAGRLDWDEAQLLAEYGGYPATE